MRDRGDVARTVVTVPRDVVPQRGCVAVGPDGDVLLAAVGGAVVAYPNRCLHVGRPLDTGVVRDGVLTCPHHLWRYRLADGRCVAGGAAATGLGLAALPVTEDGDRLRIARPPAPTGGMRDRLLAHAATWRRDLP